MAFCKICSCGKIIYAPRRLSFQDNCPECGRSIKNITPYNENDCAFQELTHKAAESTETENHEFGATENGHKEVLSTEEQTVYPPTNPIAKPQYKLKLINGRIINIPSEGGIIGRTEIGAEELAEFPSVSRKHLKILLKRHIGVIIEDLSRYGTLVNGERLPKNRPTKVEVGSKILLCNVEVTLVTSEDEND